MASNTNSDQPHQERSGFRPSRPKVVQPKPTNKNVVGSAAPSANANATAGPSSASPTAAASAPRRPAIQNAPSTTTTSSRPGGPKIIQGQGSGSTILVSNTQRGNPVVTCLKNVGWEYATIKADYQMGVSTCALFLSLKYHQVHPDYLDKRIESIAGMFNLRILLLMCDAKQYTQDIKDLTRRCLANNITILTAWNAEQAARYLEHFKVYEFKGPELIKARVQEDWPGQMTGVLTSVKKVNKSDSLALMTRFGSLRKISQATPEQLSLIAGFGEIKVKRLREAFTTPFKTNDRRTFREREAARKAVEAAHGGSANGAAVVQTLAPSGPADGPSVSSATATLNEPEPAQTVNANGKRPAADMGPDLDFGPEFDLTEEEMQELQRGLESNPNPKATSTQRAEAIAHREPGPIEREVANELRNAPTHDEEEDPIQDDDNEEEDIDAGDDEPASAVPTDDMGMDALTEEERRELQEAMALSLADDDDNGEVF